MVRSLGGATARVSGREEVRRALQWLWPAPDVPSCTVFTAGAAKGEDSSVLRRHQLSLFAREFSPPCHTRLSLLLHALPAKRQGASADKLHLEAAKTLPLVGLPRCKQDPINRGHGAQCLHHPPLPAGASRHAITSIYKIRHTLAPAIKSQVSCTCCSAIYLLLAQSLQATRASFSESWSSAPVVQRKAAGSQRRRGRQLGPLICRRRDALLPIFAGCR